jgi:FkbM family methyltransferase
MMLTTKQKIYLARWSQSCFMLFRKLLGKSHITLVTRNSIFWKLDLREGIDFAIWLMGYFEPSTVNAYKRVIRSGDIVLDIGANIGAHTLPMARLVGEAGKVIAFEPTNYAFDKLMQNVLLNPEIKNRIIANQAMLVGSKDLYSTSSPVPDIYSSWPLNDTDGVHELHQGKLMSTSHAIIETMDTYFESNPVNRVDCIKVDIDGYECEMFKGALGTLKRWKPIIVMELMPYGLEEKGGSLDELVGLLVEVDYIFYTLDGKKRLPMNARDLNKAIPLGTSINVIAISAQT